MGRSQRKDVTQKAKGGLILDTEDLTTDGKIIYQNLHGKYLVELQQKKIERALAKKKKEAEAANQVLNLEGDSNVDANQDGNE